MSGYRYLQYGEIIQESDQVDSCRDGWRDKSQWVSVRKHMIGKPAPDPLYPSHRKYRQKIKQ